MNRPVPRPTVLHADSPAGRVTPQEDGAVTTLTVPECARRLGISTNGMYLAIQRGEAPFARRLGGRIVIPLRALIAWEENGQP